MNDHFFELIFDEFVFVDQLAAAEDWQEFVRCIAICDEMNCLFDVFHNYFIIARMPFSVKRHKKAAPENGLPATPLASHIYALAQ